MRPRAAKRPQISVVLASHNGERYLARAVESVLNQDFTDIELVLVDCASTDATPRLMARYAERDIRIEVRTQDICDAREGFFAGVHAARGTWLLMMYERDWLAPGMLGSLVRLARDGADMVVPARSAEAHAESREPVYARRDVPADETFCSTTDVRSAALSLYAAGALPGASGILVDSALLRTCLEAEVLPRWPVELLLQVAEHVQRLSCCDEALFHDVEPGCRPIITTDPHEMCANHAAACAAAKAWGLSDMPHIMLAIHRRHVLDAIGCIDALCSAKGMDTRRRAQIVQELLEEPSLEVSLDAVRSCAKEFGVMYRPMVARNATGCCFGSRLRDIARISRVNMAPML